MRAAFGCLITLLVALNTQAETRSLPPQLARALTGADKATIITWTKEHLTDPYSLRSTAISDPVPVKRDSAVVCVAFDGRDRFGRYLGLKRISFVLTPDGIAPTQRPAEVAACSASTLAMKPFPELDALAFAVPSRLNRPTPTMSVPTAAH
ncbi:hypothetical protein U8607_04120 [Methylobacterium durans]|uniref:hypothetical protein n=1 Tax=Methylobacterium durans TaxID=2202825 RepID=UPI002AFFB2D1|nr:hypothetical protein [Methylobacterium durans]MEA1831263.1 hypothetical protein [Methylobacterium durans]